MIETRITKMLGIKYPIIQGGMQWLARAELAAAVSEAGGLGIISSGSFPEMEQFRNEIRKARKLTAKPLGVNITLLPSLKTFDVEGYIAALADEGITIVETAGRNPEPYMEQFKRHNIKVIHKATAVRFAVKAQQAGCDAVTIDGFECAGHPGEDDVTSLVLVPKTVDALDIPVIAAGGFVDGRGLMAALALGAEGVLMGTRFMISREAPMHPAIKEYLVNKVNEMDTTFILRPYKNTARVIKNEASRKVAELEARGAGVEEVLPLISGMKGLQLYASGDINAGVVYCSQSVGLIKNVPSVREIIENTMQEAETIRTRMTAPQ